MELRMTIRHELNAKKRGVMRITLIGFGFFATGFGLSFINQGLGVICLPGFVVAFVATMYGQFFAIRCPICRANLRALAFETGLPLFTISSRIMCCPYCGVDLDSKATSAKMPSERDFVDISENP
jgi:hypothetical protein